MTLTSPIFFRAIFQQILRGRFAFPLLFKISYPPLPRPLKSLLFDSIYFFCLHFHNTSYIFFRLIPSRHVGLHLYPRHSRFSSFLHLGSFSHFLTLVFAAVCIFENRYLHVFRYNMLRLPPQLLLLSPLIANTRPRHRPRAPPHPSSTFIIHLLFFLVSKFHDLFFSLLVFFSPHFFFSPYFFSFLFLFFLLKVDETALLILRGQEGKVGVKNIHRDTS